MLSNKRLANFNNLISPNNFLRNDRIRLIEIFVVIWKCVIIMDDNLHPRIIESLNSSEVKNSEFEIKRANR